MPQDTSTFTPFFKEDYEPAIQNQLTNEYPLLKLFEKDTTKWQSDEKIVAIRVNRNRGVYFTAEGGQPPTAGRQKSERLRIPRRHTHGSVQLTVQVMKASQSDAGAFANAMEYEMDGLLDDLRFQRAFAMWGDGRGIRALINTDPGTGTLLTLDSPGGVAGVLHGNRFLNEDDQIVAIDPLTGLLRAGGTRRISSIAAAGATVTVSAAIDAAWADNDYVVKAYGADAAVVIGNTDWQHPPMGLLGMVDNGTFLNGYFGLSRTTFPVLQSTVFSGVGSLSADIVQRGIDVSMQVGSCEISDHIMHPSVLRAYLFLMETDRRYIGADLRTPNAGTAAARGKYDSGIQFGTAPIMTDPFAAYGTWVGLDRRSARRYTLVEGEWADETGAVLTEVANAVDTYKATYRIYDNFALLRSNQSFRLDGVVASAVVAHVM